MIWRKNHLQILPEYFDDVNTWRILSILSLLQMIFYKKRIIFLQSNEEKIEHDRNIFINSDLIMTGELFKEFLVELSINESYQKLKFQKVKEFCEYVKNKNNKYVFANIAESIKNLVFSLETLIEFVEKHFSEVKTQGLFRLYPDLKHDPEFNYLDFQEQLNVLCREAESSYHTYAVNIKTYLNICVRD